MAEGTPRTAPSWRKGEMKAALVAEDPGRYGPRPAVATFEPRVEVGKPVEASNVSELLDRLAEKALRTLEEDLNDAESRPRQEAARTIVQAWSKAKAEQEAKAEPTEEEREAQLEAALQSPRLREFLEARGWKKTE